MVRRWWMGLAACAVAGCGSGAEDASSSRERITESPRARVAELAGETATFETVAIEPFAGSPFTNDVVRLRDVPEDVKPDASGCYCFAETDARFAYAHTYVHATRALRSYNARLAEIGLAPVKDVPISLVKANAGMPTTGSLGERNGTVFVEVTTSSPVVDTGVLVHEIGHIIHRKIAGSDAGTSSIPLGITELAPNLLAALELRITRFAEYAWMDAAIDLTRELHCPDRILRDADLFQSQIDAPRFAAAFPVWVGALREELQTHPEQYQAPDEYSNSALVVGPMLATAPACGYAALQRVALEALHDVRTSGTMGALSQRLVAHARTECPAGADALEERLRARGVL
ncbi:hypothetical protein LZC95_23560 [Pendulispora brunnea]|uniref:Lipoprotein n=1 Tax=Pendulispora brunnea TaxID=2905690 RepID=A0ABZ2KMN6_9BACT